MQLIFDTGSSWLWLPSKNCDKDCHVKAELFDESASTSFKRVSSIPQMIQYGGGSVIGYTSKDRVCLEPEAALSCFSDYTFLSVFKTSDLESLQSDGILGLAPSSQNTHAELFIDRLYAQNVISNRLFAFSLGGTDEKSLVTFGGYDLQKHAKPGSIIQWHELESTTYWTVNLASAKLG